MLERARRISPGKPVYVHWEALTFASALSQPAPWIVPEQWPDLKARILSASDPELLSATGYIMAGSVDPEQTTIGLPLIQRAIALDPANPKWKQTLKEAQNVPHLTASPQVVRIGSMVAESNLITKVEPVYPPLAKSSGVSGTVEFAAIIDQEGAVQNLQLMRDHPLLVSAAKDAVTQCKYRPTFLNGNPIPIATEITVIFTLPQ